MFQSWNYLKLNLGPLLRVIYHYCCLILNWDNFLFLLSTFGSVRYDIATKMRIVRQRTSLPLTMKNVNKNNRINMVFLYLHKFLITSTNIHFLEKLLKPKKFLCIMHSRVFINICHISVERSAPVQKVIKTCSSVRNSIWIFLIWSETETHRNLRFLMSSQLTFSRVIYHICYWILN